MSTEVEQIRLSYEQLGMSPAEIAEDRQLEPEAVKMTLASSSAKYRKDCGLEAGNSSDNNDGKTDLNFTDEQLLRVNDRIYEIAVSSDSEAVALDACKYIRQDKKGRLDAVKALAGTTFNVLMFNEQLRRANELIYNKPVDVESKPA